MREILFRGKCKGNGVWVEGFYACFNKKESRIYTGCAETDDGYYYPEWFTVVPETVGQYTGLKDRNGTDIFEGDIVNIIRADENGKVEWRENDAAFEVVGDCLEASFLENLYGHDVEVIGNIHDNPELLKEEG